MSFGEILIQEWAKFTHCFPRCTENESRIIMCWCGTGAQSGLSLHMWLSCSRMTCLIISSSQKKKKNHNYTDDQRTTKKSRLQSLTRWIAHCAAGTFPSASGWRPCRCGCRTRWWELSQMSAGTALSGLTCTRNKQIRGNYFWPTWASNTERNQSLNPSEMETKVVV